MPKFRCAAIGVTLVGGLVLAAFSAIAQQKTLKEQIVGTWTAVSVQDTKSDGTKADSLGPNPKGTTIYEANGRYAFIITRADLPRVAANNRNQATADEAKAIVSGSTAYFGTYTVNEVDKTVSLKVEASIFPNIIGSEQKRIITSITADEMRFTNPTTTGGTRVEAVWKRVR